jgi:hypothetical protein
MAVSLDMREPIHVRVVHDFGPFSIGTWVYGAGSDKALISLHDSGSTLVFRGDETLEAELLQRLALPPGSINALGP